MILAGRQAQFTEMIGQLILFATAHGYQLRFGDAWRSTDPLTCPSCGSKHTYQELLVFNGHSKVNFSTHSDRCAVDFIVNKLDGSPMTPADYLALGEFWESKAGRWGGRFHPLDPDGIGWDRGHFELPESTEV